MSAAAGLAAQRNRLLAALPADTLAALLPHLEAVTLPYRRTLFRPREALTHVYFPLRGMVSLVRETADGDSLETAVVGREGLVPILAVLGVRQSDEQAVIQAEGAALRLPQEALRAQSRQEGPLQALLERYTAAALRMAGQGSVCNRLHPVEERLARWLLQAQDRVEASVLPLPHEFLGLMLGVRRASVTTAEAIFQQAGLIRVGYGEVEIVDRAGLEQASCECYAQMRDAGEQVFLG